MHGGCDSAIISSSMQTPSFPWLVSAPLNLCTVASSSLDVSSLNSVSSLFNTWTDFVSLISVMASLENMIRLVQLSFAESVLSFNCLHLFSEMFKLSPRTPIRWFLAFLPICTLDQMMPPPSIESYWMERVSGWEESNPKINETTSVLIHTGFPPEKWESIMVTGGSGSARRAYMRAGLNPNRQLPWCFLRLGSGGIPTWKLLYIIPLVVTSRANMYPLFSLIHHFLWHCKILK